MGSSKGLPFDGKRSRKSRSKSRLAYMLLDVFLGGFIVGIVLLVTLGRPPRISRAEGSGGDSFLLIEYTWNADGTVVSPMIKYRDKLINRYGLASGWHASDVPASGKWFRHNARTGLLIPKGTAKRPFQMIAEDGFDSIGPARITGDIGDGATRPRPYGYVWISKPCSGQWYVGLRVVEEPLESNKGPIRVKYRVRWGGVSERQSSDDASVKAFVVQRTLKSAVDGHQAFADLQVAPSVTRYASVKIPRKSGKQFAYCTGH